jgi:hypothetical protein
MFLDILNRRAASGVNTAHSRQELQRELPKLDNLFSQDTDAERPADRFGGTLPPRQRAARREG